MVSYTSTGDGHRVQRVEDGGSLVFLEDGSKWEVNPLHKLEAAMWMAGSRIAVSEGDHPMYPYTLDNTDDSEVVEARCIARGA